MLCFAFIFVENILLYLYVFLGSFSWGMLGSVWVGGVDKGGHEGNPGDSRARDNEQRAADRHA